MTEQEPKYLQFPLFLIRGLFTDRKAVINKILNYGIYHYSKQFNYSLRNVARQVIYDHYNNNLGTELKKCIKTLNSDIIGCNDDYRGFDAEGQFDPMDEISELFTALNDKHYFNFERLAIEHYQMHLAIKSLGIENVNIEQSLMIAKQVEIEIPAKEPMPMLNINLLLDYFKNDKSEFEIAQLLVYMAIKSILGKKSYCKTNKKLILSRMFGFANHSKTTGHETELFKKYSTRYHIDKVLQELELSWHVKIYSNHMRGFYISIGEKLSLDTLASVAEKSKRKNRIAELKKKKTEAKERATTSTKGINEYNKNYGTLNNVFNTGF